MGLSLVSPFINTTLTDIGTWYDVQGTLETTHSPYRFEVINGVLTYKGFNNTSILFSGTSDTEVSKNAILSYGLFINDELTPRDGVISVHTFSTPNAFELMAITKFVELSYGDRIYIKAKSDTASTVMTPTSLDVTLLSVR